MGRVKGRGELALWIGIPILAFVVVFNVGDGLPSPECGEGGGATSGEVSLFEILVAVATFAGVVAAALRLSVLGRRGLLSSRHLIGLTAILLAAGLVVLVWGWTALGGALIVSGGVITAASLVALVLAWVLSRDVDQVGVLLPVYLLGSALLCYPALLILAVIDQSGLAC